MNVRRAAPFAVLLVVLVAAGWALLSRGSDDQPTDASAETSSTAETAGTAENVDAVEAPATTPATTIAAADLPDLGPHPDLVGIDGWLQSDIDSLDQLDGTVYAVQFWTFGCFNCKNTLPHLQELYAKYADQGFEIVGVHSPEFDYEADPTNIANAADDLGVTWPIALDPKKDSFHEWQPGRAVWPRIFIVDRDGHVRLDHKGEGAYAEIDAAVGTLLAEPR